MRPLSRHQDVLSLDHIGDGYIEVSSVYLKDCDSNSNTCTQKIKVKIGYSMAHKLYKKWTYIGDNGVKSERQFAKRNCFGSA